MAHRNDVIMPVRARFGSATAARRGVQQLFTASGFRHANQLWASPLRTLVLDYLQSPADAYAILETFHALGGPFDTFLARDWADWHTAAANDMRNAEVAGTSHTDAPLMNPNLDPITNLGDGSTTVFHTYKNYAKGAGAALNERIRHPVDDANFKVGIDGALQGSGFTVTENGGLVTFSVAPSGSPEAVLTWGGSFYRPVHFANDDLEELLQEEAYGYAGIRLQEARGV
ncbi:MAG TPA: DUF2460 domain-containing protein [Kiloniellales bacterium]